MFDEYITATSLDQAVHLLSQHRESARIVAGATDLLLEMEAGQRPKVKTLIDITRIPNLDHITMDDETIRLGPLVTHNHCVASSIVREHAFALARACWEVGAPQIRNRGTIAGNLITGSPANDSITPLLALNAKVRLRSISGEREVALKDFFRGVRQTVMAEDELLTEISFPIPSEGSRTSFLKLALRRAQAISVINVAIHLVIKRGRIRHAAITLGSVAPTIVHAREAEKYLRRKKLSPEVIERASELAMQAAQPIDDLRGSASYRIEMVRVCTRRILVDLQAGNEKTLMPENPVMLWGPDEWHWDQELEQGFVHNERRAIETTINGKHFTFQTGQQKTLMRLLREEAGLPGTKEGCAEGECGACTVFLDGMAVMSCMVNAPRAHHAEIVSIEGLSQGNVLHPVQQTFINEGAVQCGYCTPGFIMSAAKLLEERAKPSRNEVAQSITGNLCRCTGYYKILTAIERASAL